MALIRALSSAGGGGGTAYNFDFSLAAGGSVKEMCPLTDNSIGLLYYDVLSGGVNHYYSTWIVSGKTVTKLQGNASSTAFYVQNNKLYGQNQSSAASGTFKGVVYDGTAIDVN